MFGFIAMTPQLYINYRLKSVAHLPWKAFMYKVGPIVYSRAAYAHHNLTRLHSSVSSFTTDEKYVFPSVKP